MDRRREVISFLVILEFVVMAALLFVLVPLDAMLPVLPFFLVIAVVFLRYLS